jgi:hypothetical protein
LTERYWPDATEFATRKRKVKEEPDYFAAYEPEVIVNYPLDAYDDQVKSLDYLVSYN